MKTLTIKGALRRRNAINATLRGLLASGRTEDAECYLEGAYWRFLEVLDHHFIQLDEPDSAWGVLGHPDYNRAYALLKNWWSGWSEVIRNASGQPTRFEVLSEKYYFLGQEARPA